MIEIQHLYAEAFLAQQPRASAHLIMVDPPYESTRLELDSRRPINWSVWWKQAWRVLKPNGVVVMFADFRFALRMMTYAGKHFSYEMPWEKTRATGWLAANKRPMKAHEFVLVFCRHPDQSTYNPQKVARSGPSKSVTRITPGHAEHYGKNRLENYVDDGMRFPRSVLHYPSLNPANCENPTEKPLPMFRDLVRTYSNNGDLVLDTCIGSGPTAVACLLEERDFRGCDDDAKMVAITTKRLQKMRSTAPLLYPVDAREALAA